MTIAVAVTTAVTVVETKAGVYVGQDNTVTTNGLNSTSTLGASTTPPATKYSAGTVVMSGGVGSIDLTSLPDENGTATAVTLTGLKIATMVLRNKSTNANPITIAKGASNGFTGFGSAFSIVLQVGEKVTLECQALAAAVSGSVKVLDITGTASQVLEFEFTAG